MSKEVENISLTLISFMLLGFVSLQSENAFLHYGVAGVCAVVTVYLVYKLSKVKGVRK